MHLVDICSECSQSRLISEELESHNFNNSTIYVRLLDNDSKKDADRSINQLSADDEEDEVCVGVIYVVLKVVYLASVSRVFNRC